MRSTTSYRVFRYRYILQSGATETNTKKILTDKILNVNRFGCDHDSVLWDDCGKMLHLESCPEAAGHCHSLQIFWGVVLSDPELYNIIRLAVSSGGKNKSCLNAQAILVKGTNPWQMILQDIRI